MAQRTNCNGVSRRDCLQLGLGGILGGYFGSGLAGALRATAAERQSIQPQANACILIWMDGGPTHYETFDPKPDAPQEIRGEYETIQTSLPGVHLSKHCRQLAGMADQLAIVRSIRHNQGNHGAGNHYMMTGAPTPVPVNCGAFVSFHPSFGSVVSHARGVREGLPAYMSLPKQSRTGGPNFLGAVHAPFIAGGDQIGRAHARTPAPSLARLLASA